MLDCWIEVARCRARRPIQHSINTAVLTTYLYSHLSQTLANTITAQSLRHVRTETGKQSTCKTEEWRKTALHDFPVSKPKYHGGSGVLVNLGSWACQESRVDFGSGVSGSPFGCIWDPVYPKYKARLAPGRAHLHNKTLLTKSLSSGSPSNLGVLVGNANSSTKQ